MLSASFRFTSESTELFLAVLRAMLTISFNRIKWCETLGALSFYAV